MVFLNYSHFPFRIAFIVVFRGGAACSHRLNPAFPLPSSVGMAFFQRKSSTATSGTSQCPRFCRQQLRSFDIPETIIGEAQRISVSSNASSNVFIRGAVDILYSSDSYVNFGSHPLFSVAKHRRRSQEHFSVIGFVCDWFSAQLSPNPPRPWNPWAPR